MRAPNRLLLTAGCIVGLFCVTYLHAFLTAGTGAEPSFTQRHLAFKNDTARRLKAWATYHTKNARGEETWVPADPAEQRRAKVFILGPGETVIVKEGLEAVPVWCEQPDGSAAWRSAAPTVVEPGKSMPLKDLDGWLLHGQWNAPRGIRAS